MAELKTQVNDASVTEFLTGIEHEQKRADSFALVEIMREITGHEPKMWGTSIVGFGAYRYSYKSGREGEWFLVGFSPRKQNLTLYIMAGFDEYETLLEKLGKHKLGKSCLYINKLADVDEPTLRKLIKESAEHVAKSNQ